MCQVACVRGWPWSRTSGGPLPPCLTRSVASPTSTCASSNPSKNPTNGRLADVEIPQVVLAPLAGGPSAPELAAAVANAGGLGFIAGGYLTPDELERRLIRARELTDGPLGVNLFVLEESPVDDAALARYADELRAEGHELGEPRFENDWLDEKIDVVVAADIQVVSTT